MQQIYPGPAQPGLVQPPVARDQTVEVPSPIYTVGALRKSEFKKRKRAKIGPGINQLGSESESGLGSQGID